MDFVKEKLLLLSNIKDDPREEEFLTGLYFVLSISSSEEEGCVASASSPAERSVRRNRG
jgi:hypothetical protein